ncbi:MAG: AraC family transcriptional regulator ligand-binding domain-containing protein [Myxococcota bacterium]
MDPGHEGISLGVVGPDLRTRPFTVGTGWKMLLGDVGIDASSVLRRAELPLDLLSRGRFSLSPPDYARFWRGLEEEAADPVLALRLGQAISVEIFDPPVFAALCSPNLNVALERIARFKPLICPLVLDVDMTSAHTDLAITWPESFEPPEAFVLAELCFFVQLARLATRTRVEPLVVGSPVLPRAAEPFAGYFGVVVEPASKPHLRFHNEDASRPFLTAHPEMWEVFEPDLRRRLSEVEEAATTAERVRAALLELLPGGAPPMAEVAARLGTSVRTLQRRLRSEGASYQRVLSRTRKDLAAHYLRNTALPGAEISYLLGYEDPNCFFRAYRSWTGVTPGQERARIRAVS